jgi:two-component sensor histidine kinase
MTRVVPEDRHDDRERVVKLIRAGERAVGSETMRRRKDGSLFEASVTTSPILDLAGRLIGIATIVRDVTELKDSLKLKEVLLREIHHRVKNNLQVIASLLRLQASTVAGDEARRGFEESQNRIRSMALVHQLLYQSKDLASIDFEEYLRDLVEWLARSYGVHAGRIDFAVTAPGIRLDIDTSVPCGLIVNELVSNSLKHAFPDGRHGLVAVSLHRDGDGPYVLMVKDDGIGIAEHLQLETVRTLGLRIVCMLTAQLHGTVAVFRDHGTTFRITFPPPRHTHR